MTSIQPQQASRNDDHAAKTAKRAGKLSQSSIPPDAGAQFSSMVAASQHKLEANRLAAMKDNSAAESHSKKSPNVFADDNAADNGADNGANANSSQRMPPAQDEATQGQASQGSSATASALHFAQIQASSEDSPDLHLLASLLPAGADDGVFEVLMPNRSKVGVMVSDMPAGLSYLLMPGDDLLADRLRGNEMELEALLKRRIRRNVKVVVL